MIFDGSGRLMVNTQQNQPIMLSWLVRTAPSILKHYGVPKQRANTDSLHGF
ncbi:hypothetical protein HU200_038604 [Digitaria exilis]|uniref:Uncharacterized protein n=1 Tax=Digitaria exilis TaxID=1010633 RepID=A0A835BK59_9POAL|nr:hypothetical protein HU200_038604 [Digitaria exilis]